MIKSKIMKYHESNYKKSRIIPDYLIYYIFNKSLKHCWIFFRRSSAWAFFLLINKVFESMSWLKEAGNLMEGNFVNKFYAKYISYLDEFSELAVLFTYFPFSVINYHLDHVLQIWFLLIINFF